jgi:hypothetical protein
VVASAAVIAAQSQGLRLTEFGAGRSCASTVEAIDRFLAAARHWSGALVQCVDDPTMAKDCKMLILPGD